MRSSLKNVCRLLDAANMNVPIEQQFLSDLKRSIELTDELNWKIPSKTYKPSGMNCIRASYYQIIGAEPNKAQSNYCMVGICNSGTDAHVRIQTAVANMINTGMDCEYVDVARYIDSRRLENCGHIDYLDIVSQNGMETKLYDRKLNMSFMCDGIIKYKNHYYILELKTESTYKFMNRTGVDPSHYNQGTAYSLAFGIDQVLFVYINRDTFDMKAFMFNVSPEMKENLVGYIEECDGYVKRMIAPPIPVNVSKKACSYCGYKERCKKDG